MKCFRIGLLVWGLALCASADEELDYSWMTYDWVQEGPAAKRLERSMEELGAEKTLERYKQAAAAEDAEALFYIAYWQIEGIVMPKDDVEGLRALKKSAGLGYVYAQVMLGMAYYEGTLGLKQDAEMAHQWFLKGAEDGDAFAEFALASFHLEGTHQFINQEKGCRLLAQAGEKESAEAQMKLGFCFANGTGVETDIEKAAYWMERAARNGQPVAQMELGFYLYDGKLDQGRNLNMALEWIMKAAEQGHPTAEYTLGNWYARGEVVEANADLSLKWSLKAAGHGHVLAQVEVARSYFVGHGTEMNKKEAMKWFLLAAENGDIPSQEALMYFYESGDGVEVSLADSAKWALKAALNGNANAQIRLIHVYGQGLGVETDHAESYAWAIIVDHGGESEYKELVDGMYSVDEKVAGYRRSRILEKEIKHAAQTQ